ncbi:MAG: NAD(P)H-dependent oxidoreductase subunit E [Candidatus Omnitrophica bacterium]|nr:NAD(P)H-dependent oxidoreductase subunit E [Candidatus Omnitrophota bacterium]
MSAKTFPTDLLPSAEKILKNYPARQAALLPILHLFQNRDGCIKDEVQEIVSEFLSVPLIKVREVLSFYTLYAQKPLGKRHFQFCRTLTCSLLGGESLGEYFGKKCGIKPGEVTPDGQFSYEMVECLGACEIAPMLRVDKKYVGPLDEAKVDHLIQEKLHG